MSFTITDLVAAVQRAQAAMPVLEDELNRADSRLGDGDTGGMLARVIGSLAAADVAAAPDLGAAFALYAKAASSATGSSLGTLFMTALMSFSRATKGKGELPLSEFGAILLIARDDMLKRGQSALGDKTVIDAVDAVGAALAGLDSRPELQQAARAAATEVLDRFRGELNKVGRARMFGEQSRGTDDPGMLAFARLVDIVSG